MPENAYDLLCEARILMEERRHGVAVSLLERAKVMEPRKGSILEILGAAYYNCGRYELAMYEFEEALEVDPTNHYARYGLSRCLYRLGMLQRAVGQLKLAVVMAPDIDMYDETLRRLQREIDDHGGKQGIEER